MASNDSHAFKTACLECDLLLDIPALAPGARANCPRCGHLVTSHVKDGFDRSLAFALAGVILLSVACSFPFMAFARSGFSNSMTLPQTAFALYEHGAIALSGLVFGFIIVVPVALLIILITVVLAIRIGHKSPYLALLGRSIFILTPWSMVEVFVIGVIVSLVKLAAMATVTLGISFWAYIGFAICFTAAFASLDKHDAWDAIEELRT
jgi:paraquat-inducible protein A